MKYLDGSVGIIGLICNTYEEALTQMFSFNRKLQFIGNILTTKME